MTIINRNVYEPGGFVYDYTGGKCKPLPSEVSHIQVDVGVRHYVTWVEVMAARRERQAKQLKRIRNEGLVERRAAYVEVFFNPHWIYHGWHTYIHGISIGHHWVRHNGSLAENANPYGLLSLFPITKECDPTLTPMPITDYDEWMMAFASKYQRGTRGRRPRGVRFCWALCEGTYIRELIP